MSRVLLLGGTGAMGIYLVQELLNRGHEVYITSRAQHADYNGVHFLRGSGKDFSFLQKTIESLKPDAIVDFMVYGSEEFRARINFLLDETAQYVYLSSYRVFAEGSPLTEKSPQLLDVCSDQSYLSTDDYALSKARGERTLIASGRRNWTIVRPSITYSRNRFQFGCLEADVVCTRASQGLPVIMPSEMLARQTTMTWAGDVAKMIAALVLNPIAFGEDYNVVTGEHKTWSRVLEIYHEAIGLKVVQTSVSEYCDATSQYQTVYDRMFDRVMDNSKILAVASLKQEDLTPLAVGLPTELRVSDLSSLTVKNVPQMAKIDRFCGTRFKFSNLSWHDRLTYERVRYPRLEALINFKRWV